MSARSKMDKTAVQSNRKIKIFLFFTVLTTIIWLMVELSKSYSTAAYFRIAFDQVPADKLLQEVDDPEIEIAFTAPGFTILKYKLRRHKLTMDLSYVSRKGNMYYVLPNMQISGLNSQLPGEIELVEVLKDTMFVRLGVNKFKKVPVIPDLEINFKLGYQFTDDLQLNPDSVIISGPDIYIDSISEVWTEFLLLDAVSEDINERVDLRAFPSIQNIVLETEKIDLNAKVDKFTEGSFTIPVTIINEPEGIEINPFPKEIEVTFQAGLSNFSKIDEGSMTIVYDYMQIENDSLLQFLTPVIKYKSEYITSYKINPPQIEFLIQK